MSEIKTSKQLHIYCINDFHGAIESLLWWDKTKESVLNNKGVRLFSYFKKMKEDNKNSIFLSAGDMFQNQIDTRDEFEGLTPMLMKEVAFDGMAIGNHEFDWIPSNSNFISKLSNIIQCPLICCNLYDGLNNKKAEGVISSRLINVFDIKIGLMGVLTPCCTEVCTAEELGDYIIKDARENLKREILSLKSLGVDFTILLAHMDIYYDKNTRKLEGELKDLLQDFDYDDIQLVFAGHSHEYINDSINGISLLQAGAYGEAFSYAKISINTNPCVGKLVEGEIIMIDDLESSIVHPQIEEVTLAYLKDKSREKQAISYTQTDLDISIDNDNKWMNYVSELIREFAAADVAMINDKFFRKPISRGVIYDQDVLENIPFRNSLFSMTVSGDLLMEIFRKYGDEMLRGVTFTGLKMREIEVNHQYTLATTDFIAGGGDDFILLKNGINRRNHNVIIQDLVLEKLKRDGF